MTVRIKIKSNTHPTVDSIVQKYGLILTPLMPGIKGAELHFKVDNPSYEARGELQNCEEVECMSDDYGNHQPL
jgi:hypothetical protein